MWPRQLRLQNTLPLCRGVKLPHECPDYDITQSDGEAPVTPELWEIRSTPSLPLFLSPLWAGVIAPDRVLSVGQIELSCLLMLK